MAAVEAAEVDSEVVIEEEEAVASEEAAVVVSEEAEVVVSEEAEVEAVVVASVEAEVEHQEVVAEEKLNSQEPDKCYERPLMDQIHLAETW